MGRAVSQLEAPLSWARDIDYWRKIRREDRSSLADSNSSEHLSVRISVLACCCSSQASNGISGICWIIQTFKDAKILWETENSLADHFTGFIKPRPTSRVGSANKLSSWSLGGGLPVMMLMMSGMVWKRWVHLLTRLRFTSSPWVNSELALWHSHHGMREQYWRLGQH